MKRFLTMTPIEVRLAVEEYWNRRLTPAASVEVPWTDIVLPVKFELNDQAPLVAAKKTEK